MPLIVVRADASVLVGAGHVTRCVALLASFLAHEWTIGVAATAETFATAQFEALGPFERLVISGEAEQEADELSRRWPCGADILLVDHYERGAEFERACRPWARRIIAIDDLGRSHDADAVIDTGNPADLYQPLVSADCRVLTGPAYALIRDEFLQARNAALARRDGREVERVFVSFGLTDANDVITTIRSALAEASFAGAVDLVPPQDGKLLAADEIARCMAVADLAIGAAGTSAWERCCLGLPSIMLTIADNQREIAKTVASAGAAIDLGPAEEVAPERLVSVIRQLLHSAEERRSMSAAAARLIDGGGARRIVAMATALHD
jgi:spore coat polysaccharide biosynthesis predicted glycosyltransferase SpsG